MTILVFPSALEAAARFAAEARSWGRRTLGASSLEADPHAGLFDAWERLPYIGEDGFFTALETVAARHGVTEIFTPHAPTFHLLEQELPRRLPGLALRGSGPFRRQMDRITGALDEARAALPRLADIVGAPSPLTEPLLAGVLAQVETIHGECSREKVLALCAVTPTAPRGDVVEIGALFGKSSYVLNRIAAHQGVGATICVDPWDLGESVQTDAPDHIQTASEGWNWEIVHQGFLTAMLGCAAAPFNYLRMTSAEARSAYDQGRVVSREFGTTPLAGKIAILHIDGNHDEAAVQADFDAWGPLVQAGGWVIFDDYNWPHGDGPRKVADRAIAVLGDRVKRAFVGGGAMFVNLKA